MSRFRLTWPVDSHVITQPFGVNPQIYARYHLPGHEGIDFRAPVGSNVYACADGQVFEIRPNNGNPYGLNVRVRHLFHGQEYRTVYAHLSQALVSKGQNVRAGERIGLAGNTGHCYGAHLHLTLKLIGAKTSGYPDGIIDPMPYLQDPEEPKSRGLLVYASDRVRLRTRGAIFSSRLAWISAGQTLAVLGDTVTARDMVGRFGMWIHVQREDGLAGYVAAWHVQLEPPANGASSAAAEEPSERVVYVVEPLCARSEPATDSGRVAVVLPHEALSPVGDPAEIARQVGDRGQWLEVIVPSEDRGYVPAWQLKGEPGLPPRALYTAYAAHELNVSRRPVVGSESTGQVAQNAPLDVFDDADRARAMLGRFDEWLYIETVEGQRGWVPASYLSASLT